MTINARSWLIWVCATAVLTMVARNPLYASLILLVTLLMMATFGRSNRDDGLPLWRLAILFLLIPAIYNALFVHVGQTVIFRLPAWPLVGGPITLEAIVEGASNGLTLFTLLMVFAALSAIVPMSDLTRLMPAAFRDLGVVLLIAVNYVPETRRQLKRIREAQAIRGHELRGLRDWRPLVVPLLVGGLERAMRLSETMVARGYGSTADVESHPLEQLLMVFGLLAAVAGWFLVLWQGAVGWVLLMIGGSALLSLLWIRGRRAKRTTLRPQSWRTLDSWLLFSALLALVIILLPWTFVNHLTLNYVPYPSLSLPPFDWLIVLALIGLALPAAYAAMRGELNGKGGS